MTTYLIVANTTPNAGPRNPYYLGDFSVASEEQAANYQLTLNGPDNDSAALTAASTYLGLPASAVTIVSKDTSGGLIWLLALAGIGLLVWFTTQKR